MFSDPVIDTIIRSLEDHPEEWALSRYEATHEKSRTKVWIGNGLSALKVSCRGYEKGGISSLSIFFGFLVPGRVRLWRTTRSLAKGRIIKAFEGAPQ